jgi:hypothetical protein
VTAVVVVLVVVVALLVVLVVSLLRSHAEILRTLHDAGPGQEGTSGTASRAPGRPGVVPGTPPGGPSPEASDITGVTPDGDAVAIGIVGADAPTLLAFLSSGCLTCREFWETFGERRRDVPGGARLVVVTMSPEDENVAAIRRLTTEHTVVVMSTPAWEAYEVEGSPYFVYVDGESGAVVGEGTATSWPRVREMVDDSVDDGALAMSRRRAAARQRRAARRHLADRQREARADEALRAAGIEPGDPRLYPATGSPEATGTPGPDAGAADA